MILSKLKYIVIAITWFCLCFYAESEAQTIMETLKNNSQTAHFAAALEESNLDDRLNKDGPFTIFVPANKEFNGLSSWQKSSDDLLLNHIFMGMATERSLKVMSNVTFLSGKTIPIENNGNGQVLVNSYYLEDSNIKANNGVIHIISGVIK